MKCTAKLRIIFCSDNSKSKNTQGYIVFNLYCVVFYAQKNPPTFTGERTQKIKIINYVLRCKT